MNTQDFLAALHVRQINGDLPIETTRAQQRRIEHVRPIRGRDDDDPFLSIKAVHFNKESIKGLFALVVATTDSMAAMTADRVDFVDENDTGRRFLPLLEHIAHSGCADADEHFHEIRTTDREEWHVRFTGNSSCQQRLTRAGRANEQNALWNTSTELLKFFRVTQEFYELLHFVLSFLNSGNILKRDLVLISGEHSRLRFTEVQRTFACHPDLLAEKEIENQKEKRDREKPNERLRHQIRLHFDGRLDACLGEALL